MDISIDLFRQRLEKQRVLRQLGAKAFTGRVYLVGGAIRELFLGKAPRDFDFALDNPDDIAKFEETFRARAFLLGKKPMQIYRIAAGGTTLDITLLSEPIEVDLARRDFTINALACDLASGELIDPLGGLDDMRSKLIRCPKEDNLASDPLRMLKAIRHFVTLKGFLMDGNLVAALFRMAPLISTVAPERIKYEMDLIVPSASSFAGMKILESSGLLFQVFPELQRLRRLDLEKQFELETLGHTIAGFRYLRKYGKAYGLSEEAMRTAGYALLFHDLGKADTFSYDNVKRAVHFFYHERFSKELAAGIMERLRFSTHETRTVLSLIEHHMRIFLISIAEATGKATRRLVYKMGDLTPSLIVLSLCDMYGSSGGQENESTKRVLERCSEIVKAHEEWRKEPLPQLVNGKDLLAIGFSEGPALGRCLTEIRDRQIAGEITDREGALAYATTDRS